MNAVDIAAVLPRLPKAYFTLCGTAVAARWQHGVRHQPSVHDQAEVLTLTLAGDGTDMVVVTWVARLVGMSGIPGLFRADTVRIYGTDRPKQKTVSAASTFIAARPVTQ